LAPDVMASNPTKYAQVHRRRQRTGTHFSDSVNQALARSGQHILQKLSPQGVKILVKIPKIEGLRWVVAQSKHVVT
jgi:hypothetical protein